jgi:hypothetical protein
MNIPTTASRVIAGMAIATMAALIPAANAAAIPDPGQPPSSQTVASDDPDTCPLRRVGIHRARCDYLTGGWITTPTYVPTTGQETSDTDQRADIDLLMSSSDCPLRRVGTHLVRCDYLTGGDVDAPTFIPEL